MVIITVRHQALAPYEGVLPMATISHTAAFRAQADFAPEAKIKVGKSVWSEGVAGARLYELVLSKHPGTIGKAIALASELKERPFTAKAVQGHLKWLYTAGELEVDGTSYVVQAKPKPAKVEAPKAEPKPEAPKPEAQKPEPKFKPKVKAKVAASSKRSLVRTKRAA
jgi:hypothetical protein